VSDRATKEPAAELVTRTIAEALDRGLLLMGSGVFSNVIRFLPPLNIEDSQLERGLSVLEESLVAARAAG
jgi:4-aminobutyrate aminotransferase/(S)-3-amino-2-methylpropionate transaminase